MDNGTIRERTALRLAAIRGHRKIVQLLLGHDANINLSEALNLAAEQGHKALSRCCLLRTASTRTLKIIPCPRFQLKKECLE